MFGEKETKKQTRRNAYQPNNNFYFDHKHLYFTSRINFQNEEPLIANKYWYIWMDMIFEKMTFLYL